MMKIAISLALLVGCIVCMTQSAVPVEQLDEPLAQVPSGLDDLDSYEFWNLMMIASIVVGADGEEADEVTNEVVYIIQEQFDRINRSHKLVQTRKEFDKLYDQAIATPCQKIKQSFERNNKVFDNVPDEERDEEIADDGELVRVCDDILLNETKKAEFFEKMRH